MTEPSATPSLRTRLTGKSRLLGTFIKTPGPHGIEIIGRTGFDFVVIDEEHAPFDRAAIDIAMLAAGAAGIPALVRVSGIGGILSALDLGASGVMVPHVYSAAIAHDVVAACRYRGDPNAIKRGFTNSCRAGAYGRRGLTEHVQSSDEATVVIAMIEDPQALDAIDEIAAVPGIDAFFLGRGDLTVAFGAPDPGDPRVREAVARICTAVRKAGKTLCAMVGQPEEAAALRELGVSAFIMNSDQGMLRQAALSVVQAFAQLRP